MVVRLISDLLNSLIYGFLFNSQRFKSFIHHGVDTSNIFKMMPEWKYRVLARISYRLKVCTAFSVGCCVFTLMFKYIPGYHVNGLLNNPKLPGTYVVT